MKPQQITIEPTYTKENGLWVKELKPLVVEGQTFSEVSVVCFPPGQVGGNHHHPRSELFIVLSGELELTYIDENTTETITLAYGLNGYIIPSNMPHAVRNTGNTPAYLIEYASAPQTNVEGVTVL